MVFPRALRVVRGQESISQAMVTAQEPATAHVRESSGLYALLTNQLAGRSTRPTAMQVPAFVDALKTYTHTISAFPLREYFDGQPVPARQLLSQPSPIYPYANVIQRTLSDLLMFDRAYWRVIEEDFAGYPISVEVMRVEDTTDLPPYYAGIEANQQPPAEPFFYLGKQVTSKVIKFYGSGEGGWLANGATAITTAAALEAATLMYSETPIPTVALKNSGPDLAPEKIDELLDAWEEARANRGTAYLNNTIDAQVMGFSARDVQLVEAKNMAAVAIARLANLDPIWVGAGVPGSSLTYSNRVDLYRNLLDTALRPVMNLVTQRLSMPDVTSTGYVIDFDTTAFLRDNIAALAEVITKLLPLEVITVEDAQNLLDLPTLGVFNMNGALR